MKYTDIPTNLNIHPINGDISLLVDNRAISTQIKNLVLTNFYEKLHDPTIGCSIYHSLFDNFDQILADTLKKQILQLLYNHVERAVIHDCVIVFDYNTQHLICTIIFTCINEIIPISLDVVLRKDR